jgi:NAD(P)-dependent dehydrogenase (short-subunit alcohol dehydrogenase family)
MKTASLPADFEPRPNLLEGKVILVTGATGGYGRAMSKIYAAAGATVILLGKNVRALEEIYDQIEESGAPQPAIYPLNLEGATEKDYHDMAGNIGNEFGRLDGLLHAAALLGAPTPFEHSDSETWFKVMQVNLHAPYLLTKHLIGLLKQPQRSSLVFMTDDKPGTYWDAYMVSKGAIDQLATQLAREYAGSGLRVNSVNPGPSRTALQLRAFPALESNRDLPGPEAHENLFLYLMSDRLRENERCFRP